MFGRPTRFYLVLHGGQVLYEDAQVYVESLTSYMILVRVCIDCSDCPNLLCPDTSRYPMPEGRPSMTVSLDP